MTSRPRAVKRETILERHPDGRVARVAYRARIVMSDGSEVLCEHTQGHMAAESLKRCSGLLFKALEKAAGT